MKPLKNRLTLASKRLNTPLYIIEKDYLLGRLLTSIALEPVLSRTLVFKGGTALKKMYFGNYRFSEDLDFSTQGAPKGKALEILLAHITKNTEQKLNAYGPFQITLKRKPERAPHPFGQEAFLIHAQFPWHRTAHCHVKLELTHDEPVLLPPTSRCLLHDYDETTDARLLCYTLEEIIAEKLRTLLQTHRNLVDRGWNRPRARDYYDLWHLLNRYRNQINISLLTQILKPKCEHRQVRYEQINDFFTDALLSEAKQHWQSNLGHFVVGLPPCEKLLQETKNMLLDILPELTQPV